MSHLPFHKLPGSSGLDGIVLAQGATAATSRKVTLTAVVDPTVNDDSSGGYGIFSVWVNTASNQIFFCTDDSVGAAVWTSGGGGAKHSVTAANTFSVGDVVRRTAGGWTESQADSAANAEVVGIVETASVTAFTIVLAGIMSHPAHGFTIGDVLFVSPTVAGLLTATEPSTDGQVSKPVAIVVDADNLAVINMRGFVVGQTLASEGAPGVIELATQTETNTGTDDARAVTPLKLATNVTRFGGLKNLVYNGCARINQRVTAITISGSNQYAADRFIWSSTGSGLAGSAVNGADTNFASGYRHQLTGYAVTTGKPTLKTRLESVNTAFLNGKTITVSARVYHDWGASADFQINVSKANAADDFSAVTSIATSGALAVGNAAYTDISFTATLGATDGATGLQISIEPVSNQTLAAKLLYVGDIQLEIGSIETLFESRSVGLELVLCARYYQKTYNFSVAPGTNGATGAMIQGYAANNTYPYELRIQFPIEMRGAPTVTLYSFTGASGKLRDMDAPADVTCTAEQIGTKGFNYTGAGLLTANNRIQGHYVAISEL